MNVPDYILNHTPVVAFFGYWPSFHDANVLAYNPQKDQIKTVGFTLHTWHMTNEVDSKGFYVLRNHALISFRFSDIFDVAMENFKTGNILFDLQFFPSSDSSSFRIELNSVMDTSGSFCAKHGEVISVRPCSSEGKEIV